MIARSISAVAEIRCARISIRTVGRVNHDTLAINTINRAAKWVAIVTLDFLACTDAVPIADIGEGAWDVVTTFSSTSKRGSLTHTRSASTECCPAVGELCSIKLPGTIDGWIGTNTRWQTDIVGTLIIPP